MQLLRQIVEGMVSERLRRAQLVLQLLIAQRGQIIRYAGRLRAGQTWLDEDSEIVEAVQRIGGVGAAVFLGDSPISIAAPSDEDRRMVDHPSDQVIDRVLHSGGEYEGGLESRGRRWAIRFAPLPDAAGQTVGMTATFLDEEKFIEEFEEFRTPLERGLTLKREHDGRRRETARTVLALLGRMTTRLRIVALNASIISASFDDRSGFDVVASEMSSLTTEVRDLLATIESVLLGVGGDVESITTAAGAAPEQEPDRASADRVEVGQEPKPESESEAEARVSPRGGVGPADET